MKPVEEKLELKVKDELTALLPRRDFTDKRRRFLRNASRSGD